MLPLHVSLVPYRPEPKAFGHLMKVADALQTQVIRDFAPVWNVSAVVSPFSSLEDVPPASLPIVIVPEGTMPPRDHGFHLAPGGRPLALVADSEGWSVAASHELLEMLVDPQGRRRVRGQSLEEGQGQVEYLMEVCDPCQKSTYSINDIEVSDFVTPAYYAPTHETGRRYTFLGEIDEPLGLAKSGGYITWYTSDPETPIWQAHMTEDGPRPRPFFLSTVSREYVDYFTDLLPPKSDPGTTSPTASTFGKRLRREIELTLEAAHPRKPEVDIKDLLSLLKELGKGGKAYEDLEQYPELRSSRFRKVIGTDVRYPGDAFPTPTQFRAVHDALQAIGGAGFSTTVAAVAMQGMT